MYLWNSILNQYSSKFLLYFLEYRNIYQDIYNKICINIQRSRFNYKVNIKVNINHSFHILLNTEYNKNWINTKESEFKLYIFRKYWNLIFDQNFFCISQNIENKMKEFCNNDDYWPLLTFIWCLLFIYFIEIFILHEKKEIARYVNIAKGNRNSKKVGKRSIRRLITWYSSKVWR